MAEKGKPSSAGKKAKSYQVWKMYQGKDKKNKTCPKCGPGFFLANHKDRLTCGKCGYMEKR